MNAPRRDPAPLSSPSAQRLLEGPRRPIYDLAGITTLEELQRAASTARLEHDLDAPCPCGARRPDGLPRPLRLCHGTPGRERPLRGGSAAVPAPSPSSPGSRYSVAIARRWLRELGDRQHAPAKGHKTDRKGERLRLARNRLTRAAYCGVHRVRAVCSHDAPIGVETRLACETPVCDRCPAVRAELETAAVREAWARAGWTTVAYGRLAAQDPSPGAARQLAREVKRELQRAGCRDFVTKLVPGLVHVFARGDDGGRAVSVLRRRDKEACAASADWVLIRVRVALLARARYLWTFVDRQDADLAGEAWLGGVRTLRRHGEVPWPTRAAIREVASSLARAERPEPPPPACGCEAPHGFALVATRGGVEVVLGRFPLRPGKPRSGAPALTTAIRAEIDAGLRRAHRAPRTEKPPG